MTFYVGAYKHTQIVIWNTNLEILSILFLSNASTSFCLPYVSYILYFKQTTKLSQVQLYEDIVLLEGFLRKSRIGRILYINLHWVTTYFFCFKWDRWINKLVTTSRRVATGRGFWGLEPFMAKAWKNNGQKNAKISTLRIWRPKNHRMTQFWLRARSLQINCYNKMEILYRIISSRYSPCTG